MHLDREVGGPGTCELGLLSVRVDAQDAGVGRQLLEAGEAYAAEHLGAERIELHVVSTREKLLAWYERRGYAPTGQTLPFEPPGEQRSMQGPLTFDVLEKHLG